MAITLEAIRAAGGIVHSDGNIFFRDISMLQGLAGAAPAAVAGPAKELAELELLNKLIKLGGEASYALAQSNSDDGRAGAEADDRWRKLRSEMGELIRAHKAPALEAPAAPVLVGDEQADAYLTDPGRLESLARSHPAGLVRALARAALAAAPQAPSGVLGWVHPQWAVEQGRGRIYGHNPGGYIAVQIASPQAPAAPSAEGLREQHYRDSAELRRLCQARDEARRERDLARAEIAGLQTSTGHLSALVDGQHALLEKAKATMTALHGAASPIDESAGDFDARIPASAFARFVDAHAELLHAMAQSPVAAPAAPAVDASDTALAKEGGE